jgi:hypothetical protein
MRSGPATRTAFTSVNLASAVSALSVRIPALQRFSGLRQRTMLFAHKVHLHRNRAQRCAVPPCETVSEEAATPWLPATLARFWEPLGILLGPLTAGFSAPRERATVQLPQNQPCTITGSATFTLAVNELSRISFRRAIRNLTLAVRKLWTTGLPCGKAWKRWTKISQPPISPAVYRKS